VFGLLSRAAAKQFIATRMGHVTQEKNKEIMNIFHANPLAITSPKIKQGGRSEWNKKVVRAEQRFVKPISLVLHLVLSNCSVSFVLIFRLPP